MPKINYSTLMRRIKTLLRYCQAYGLTATLNLARQRIKQTARKSIFHKIDLLGFYNFVCEKSADHSIDLSVPTDETINWVIPPFGKGSGGHLNIFRFVYFLEQMGFICRIIIVGAPLPTTAAQAKKEIADWFSPISAPVYIGMDEAPPAHYIIATGWQTAYYVRAFTKTRHRCYFVQDFEPWFYPMGSEYIFAEETYRFGFTGITAGSWLKAKLQSEYDMTSHAIGFAYDKHLYSPQPSRYRSEVKRVFFYARPPTSRRAFELGLLVLNEVHKRLPQVEALLAGWDISEYEIPFNHKNVGLVSLDELAELYGQCDAALVISLSNLSLLPLELMACGTPVISNRAPWTEWLLNEQNSKLAAPTIDGLATAICTVLTNESEYNRLRNGGFKAIADLDWRAEATAMAAILRDLERNEILHQNTVNAAL